MKRFLKIAAVYFIPIAVFAAVIIWLVFGLSNTMNAAGRGELSAVKNTLENGITLCYAIEGAYPPDLEHLKENYGVVYDTEKYIVNYECFADNIRPTVNVIERRGAE